MNPAPLTVAANDASRPEGEPNPAFTASYAGFVPGEGAEVLGGTLTFATPATVASPPADYAITPGGVSAANYDIAFVDGVLTVTPAAVTTAATGTAEEAMAAEAGAAPSPRRRLRS